MVIVKTVEIQKVNLCELWYKIEKFKFCSSFVLEIVKLKANYDFGNYKLGAYNKRTILGCAIDGNQDFLHTWKWSVKTLKLL